MAGQITIGITTLLFIAVAVAEQSTMQYDTIVVGLGAAGVTAASTLASAGRKVLGLEAQGRIGGRVHTVPFGDGVVELGAEWIHGQHGSRVYETAVRNNVTVLSQNLTLDVYRSDGSRADSVLVNELVEYCLSAVEAAAYETVPLGEFITRKLKETRPELLEDEDFLDSFLDLMDLVVDNYEGSDSWYDVSSRTDYEELGGDQHLSWHRHGYKTFFELMLNTYQGGPGYPNLDIKLNAEVSKIAWPQRPSELVQVTCADGQTYKANNVIVTVSVGVLKDRHRSLFEPPLPEAKVLAVSRLSMGTVDKVVLAFPHRWWPDHESYWFRQTRLERERELNETGWVNYFASSAMGSRNAISVWHAGRTARLVSEWGPVMRGPVGPGRAMHAGHTGHASLFTPPVPKVKVKAINSLTMGVMDKIVFTFTKPWWPTSHTFFGFLWRPEDRRKVAREDRWTTRIFGASSPLGSGNTLTLWTSGESGKLVETLPEDLVKRKSVELLQKFLGANVTVPEPTGMIRTTWYSNPYTRGSYTFDSMESMKYPDSRKDLGTPLLDSAGTPRVLFAGEATNLRHFSTVHGASETGYREAMRLLPSSKI
ncbi:unnamed protein product, partial [Iphiclides podalirius]